MTENFDVFDKPSIETVKRLLLQDLCQINNSDKRESTFCEVDDELPMKIEVSRTYSKPTPQKRILRSVENTLYSPKDSPKNIQKHKRKKVIDEDDDATNRSIVEIMEQFRKVEDFQLAVE